MYKNFTCILIVLTLFITNNICAQLYVNPSTGNDTNPGTSTQPFQSIRGALRNLPGPNTTIYIQAGDYPYSTMTSNANRNLGFGPGQSVTSGINNANLPGTVIEGQGCVYWHNSNDNGTGAQNSIMTVEAVNGFTIRNINFLGWQGSNASLMFINCTNVLIENCTFHQCALNSATALRFDGDASETAISGNPSLLFTVNHCEFQNNGNPSGQGTGQALYIRNNGTLHLPPATSTYIVNVNNSTFKCNYAATGGAVYSQAQNSSDEHPQVNFNACNFSGNYASSQGGAVFGKYSDLSFVQSGFCNNNANSSLSDRDGGAIHTDQGATLSVDNCVFQDNICGRYGSAISIASNATSAGITNSVFYSNNLGNSTNSVVRTGGATTTITNSLFKDNATNALLGTMTVSNSTFSGNPGSTVAGTGVVDDHALPAGSYIDDLGHAWDNMNTLIGFPGTFGTLNNCASCPLVPSASACDANAGGNLFTTSATASICSPLVGGLTPSTDEIIITNVSGWIPPSCGISTYHYYYLVVGSDGLIKKVIDGDADSDGIPDFAESPAVNTTVNLGGLVPGTYSVVGFYSSTGTPPSLGVTPSAAAAGQSCASVSQGELWYRNCLAITGNVFDDNNGLNDPGGGIVNGVGTNTGGSLYALLVDGSGNVIDTCSVSSTGTYAFLDVAPNSTYNVVLSTTPGTVGQPAPAPSLPAGWVNTGESNTTGVGNDGMVNGMISVTVGTSSVENINFGIDQIPNSTNFSTTIPTPPVNTVITLNASTYANVTAPAGNDPEDGNLGAGNTIVITSLPANSLLSYNGTPVTLNQVIPNFNPALMTITLNTPGSTGTSFTFAYRDSAGVEDPTPATYSITWAVPLPVMIKSIEGTSLNATTNLIYWTVVNEENLQGYVVERSVNGTDFEEIGFVSAVHSSEYSFTDNQVSGKVHYYRLKALDINQSFKYSSIVQIISDNNSHSITIYPNPAGEYINILFENIRGAQFEVVNTLGQRTVFDRNERGLYYIGHLPSGTYFIYVNGVKAKSFIIGK